MERLYHLMRTLCAAVVLGCLASLASAQETALAEDLAAEDDRGFIVGLLEDALGGEGRIVRVDGFAGALSSTATIQRLTVADANGVWLTIEDMQLKWARSALLRGRIDVDQLSAAKITLERPPVANSDAMPSAEARGFTLPNLPVSVSIDQLKVDRILLNRTILGEQAEMSLDATAQLADGSGSTVLTARRIDGKQGWFAIEARYDAQSEMAAIQIDLDEPEGGIVARMLNLPERPDLKLQVAGEGSIDDLVTDISLETGGVQRIDGQITLRGSSEAGRAFGLDLDGDLTALLPPEYHSFFGTQSTLNATVNQTPDGALELTELTLNTRALSLQGAAAIDSDYNPLRLDLVGRIQPETGDRVILPGGGGNTSIAQANLQVSYDAAVSDIVGASFDITDLDTEGLSVSNLQMAVEGTLDEALAAQNRLQAQVKFQADGVGFSDAGQQQAFGDQITGSMQIDYDPATLLRLNNISVIGNTYDLGGMLIAQGMDAAFETEVDLTLKAQRLSQFSALAGTDLTGRASLGITGQLDLGGAFNLKLAGTTTDLGVGIAQANKAFAGVTKLNLTVVRDETGTQLPQLDIKNAQLEGSGSAVLKTDASKADFNVILFDSSRLDARLDGPIRFEGQADQDAGGWVVDTNLTGPFDANTTLAGRVTGDMPSLRFSVRLPDVSPLARQFSGPASLSGTARRANDIWRLETDLTGPYGITGALEGTTSNLSYSLRIPNVAALGAQIDGALTAQGTAAQIGSAWQIDTAFSGLSGTQSRLSGRILQNGSVDLQATGTAPLALANPFLAPRNLQGRGAFDLALRGQPTLTSLSGSITTNDARLSAPTLRFALTGINARIDLARARATVDATADVSSGGRIAVQGPVVLTNSMSADLSLALNSVRIVDPALFETRLNGQLSLRGPLGGGAVIAGQLNVGETNIRVPDSKTAGFTVVPPIVHRGASKAVRQTLDRAGLETNPNASSGSGSSRAGFGLDIAVSAPSRIFVRGRGIDAELGGGLRVLGRTNQMISTGQFNLIRGRIDLLGKRFVLDEGRVALQGTLDPYIRFVATTQTTVGTASITIEGLASEPVVSFTSTPQAPEDEVLAQIFFGREISTLSTFQALQLASGVATLAGKGGTGIISKLRNGLGLDDIDVTTDDEGNTGLKLGKYISDNIYTDVTVGSEDTAGVSINIDLTKSITARGQVKSNGDSSLGVFFERDY